MKIAIISDIHSNLEAFLSVLNYLKENDISEIVNLGDIVGYGANPIECLEMIMYMDGYEVNNISKDLKRAATGFNIHTILGNHDAGVVNFTDLSYFNTMAYEAILWTRKQLQYEHITFIKKLNYSYKIDGKYSFYHSTPHLTEEWKYLIDKSTANYCLKTAKNDIIFVGHTHVPKIFIYNKEKEKIISLNPELKEYNFRENNKYIFNPGSVGQPRDGNYMSSFLILDTKREKIEYKRIDYEVKKAQKKIVDNNLPFFLAERLSQGN